MNDREERARVYRERAAFLRRVATQTRVAESRTHLLVLAANFERLAEAVEAELGDSEASPIAAEAGDGTHPHC